jgi:hypothetical protein
MRKIPLSHSLLSFLDELEYTEAALASWPETKHLAALFREEIEAYDDAAAKERSARRDVVRAEALVATGNGRVDGLTMRFGTLLLAEAGRDRASPLFKRFFPEAPSIFIRRSLRQQCERILNVFEGELSKLPEASPLRPVGEQLRSAAEEALAALDVRTTAKASRAVMGSSVDDWKEGVNRLRLSTYGELLRISVEQRFDKDWSENFFRSSSRAQTRETDTEAAESPAAADA